MLEKFKIYMESLEGYLPFKTEDSFWKSLSLGFYWFFLLMLVLCFVGRGAKFIYVDF